MNKQFVSFLLPGLFLFSFHGLAEATLMSEGSSFGTDTITLDTDTGIKWLDVTLSTPFSRQSIQSEFSTGGTFEGFRLASMEEVYGLWANAGVVEPQNVFIPENYDPVRYLMSFVGISGPGAGNWGDGNWYDYTMGHIADIPAWEPDYAYALGIAAYDGDFTGRTIVGVVSVDNMSSTHGSWLVLDSAPVPEPGTIFLFGAGLLGLYGARIRKNIRP